jgi:Tetratricopeptide repeat
MNFEHTYPSMMMQQPQRIMPANQKNAGMSAADKARDYLQKGKFKEAADKFEAWVKKYPMDKNAWLDYGACLYHLARLEPALAATRRALEIDKDFSLASNNIGLYYQMKNDSKKAIEWYAKAANAGYKDANFNLALSMLRDLMDDLTFDEKWDSAWDMYTWRFKKTTPVPLPGTPPYMTRGWDGVSPVMLMTEQGVGDTIMFSRYVDKCPAGSIFAIPEALNEIFGHKYKCINDTTLAGSVTQWIPLADLCLHFKEIPPGAPITNYGGNKIGVCWEGNKEHANDHNRSYPGLKKEMLSLENAVSLQFGHNPNLKRWQDTMDLMKQCKTIITVDTSVAHLAGYLGIRTLVLMPRFDWDFRWGTGKTNHWYPSITAYSTWEELIADL